MLSQHINQIFKQEIRQDIRKDQKNNISEYRKREEELIPLLGRWP